MSNLKQMPGSNWHIMRVLRLAVGVWIGIEAISSMQLLPGLVSIFFLYQAITNTGCCGTQACNTPTRPTKRRSALEDVEYEEVK
jgi:hypothetical protein